jgi:C1A family cysteine protease
MVPNALSKSVCHSTHYKKFYIPLSPNIYLIIEGGSNYQMKKSDYAMKFCGLILLLIVIVSLFVGVVSAEGLITDNITIEDAKVPKLAPLNPDFLAYRANLHETFYGYIPPPIDLSHLNQISVERLPPVYGLPSSFDWRDQSKVTSVKDQDTCGTCWIFGTTSVLESAVLIGESVAYDFSEHSVALCVDRSWYYLYDGSTDPCQAGGWGWLASEVFIKKGSVFETCNPYECSALNCDDSCVCDNCPTVKKVDGYRLATNDGSQIEVIKNAVYNQGPVTMAFYYSSSGGYSVAPWGLIYDYYPCSGSANHLVSIIGWNDAVPHPNPGHAGTGAWIVKNSWGTGWGNEGFFYLAYDSSCVTEIAYLKYKDDNPDEELLCWDEAGLVNAAGYGDNSAWMANVFTTTQSGDLTHVDFWTTSNNAQYELYVWNGFFGTEELAYQTGNCQEYGYYSIPLSESISIDAEQQFTVGVKITTPGFDYPIPIECEATRVAPPIQTGVSFIRYTASGTWTDLADYGLNACLRARLTILVAPECEGTDTSCGIYPNCENCNEYDGCYEYGDGCEERDYYCESNEAGCNYTYSNRHTDYYDDFVNYCKNDEVWKHRLFHDFSCDGGSCVDHTNWVDDQLVENCSDRDGWYCSGDLRADIKEYRDYNCSQGSCTYTIISSENCNELDGCYAYEDGCEDRDYYCSGGSCVYIHSNRRIDYYDDWVTYCKGDEVWKHRLFHNFSCDGGTCTDHTSWVDDQLVENCSTQCTANNTVKKCYDGNCTDTGICNSTICGADVACEGKKPGESCGTGTCDSNCKCRGQAVGEDIGVFRDGGWHVDTNRDQVADILLIEIR